MTTQMVTFDQTDPHEPACPVTRTARQAAHVAELVTTPRAVADRGGMTSDDDAFRRSQHLPPSAQEYAYKAKDALDAVDPATLDDHGKILYAVAAALVSFASSARKLEELDRIVNILDHTSQR